MNSTAEPMPEVVAEREWRQALDAMDGEGYVHLSLRPGFGYDMDWGYIEAHTIAG